jgi:flagellar basal body-associated protein FliL
MLSAAPLSDAARAQESPNVSEPTAAPAKAKSKKLIIIVAALAVLLVAGGAAAWLLLGKRGGGDEEEGHAPVAQAAAPKTPPTFLPMENMVVNLADPGGDRFAQVGITLELADAKTGELVKSFMPSIRSNVLLLVSQRSTEELTFAARSRVRWASRCPSRASARCSVTRRTRKRTTRSRPGAPRRTTTRCARCCSPASSSSK